MNERDIEHMWKVASNNPNHDTNWHDPVVIAFAELIRADEREACAKFLERIDLGNLPPNMALHYELLINSLVNGIRARGNT